MATDKGKSHMKCCVVGCKEQHKSLHFLPAKENRTAWLHFIFDGHVPATISRNLVVCANHFKADCFENLGQYTAGLASRLRLTEGSVPAVRGKSADERYSQSRHTPIRNDVSCQTDAPSVTSQSTQLSLKTLSPHVRSKGVQTTLSCQSVSEGYTSTAVRWITTQPGTSPPADFLGQTKRPRLEWDEDEDEREHEAEKKVKVEVDEELVDEVKVKVEYESESEVDYGSTGCTDPPDLTHDLAQPGADEQESSELAGTSGSANGDAKFIVFEQCLLSLFEHCPVCTGFCNVRPHKRGNILTVEQLCHHCEFFRTWRSQPQ